MIQFHVPLYLVLSVVGGTVFPVLVGLVTSKVTDSKLQAVYLAALSVLAPLVGSVADALQNHTAFDLGTALLTAIATFVTGVALHFGLWKPTGVADKAQSVFASDTRPGGLLGNTKDAPVVPTPVPAPAPAPVTPPAA
ncbi:MULTISPECIES: hypothetical protein [Arthrobacter]|uniref:hypothetical protein n=1 Tax=Arthrobacter TaxID=1663 RepID=UPI00197ABA39|nr:MULTISPECIES: hypothetical protein [Arthrobacter]MBT8160970.1 hypothetical protein [Arthrobacter sp. GN70]